VGLVELPGGRVLVIDAAGDARLFEVRLDVLQGVFWLFVLLLFSVLIFITFCFVVQRKKRRGGGVRACSRNATRRPKRVPLLTTLPTLFNILRLFATCH
jgi:hypothetical protein